MAWQIDPGDTNIYGTLTRIFGEIEVQLKRAQEAADTLPAAEREFRANALKRLFTDLAPLVDTLRARIQRGVLTATSDTEVLLVDGAVRTWIVPEADRASFAPSPFILAIRRLSMADTALLRVTGWDTATGGLTAEVIEITGNPGPHADWEFVSGPGVITAQRTWLAEGRAAHAAIEMLADLVEGYRDAAAGSATASGLDRQQTGLDKLATGNDRAEVLRLRNETVAAAGTVDTTNFLQLDGLRQLAGKLRLAASAAGRAAFNMPAGTDPSAPAEGDAWNTGGILKAFLGGVTRVFAFLGLAQTWTARQTFAVPLNLAPGGTSAAPADGDLRITGAGVFARYGGVEAQLADASVVAAAIGGKADKATTPTLDDVRTLAIQISKLKGSTVGMAAGVADDFRDKTGYDTAGSVAAYHDASANQILNGNADPSTVLLMHFDGTTEETGKYVYNYGSSFSTAQSVFGGGSGYFTGGRISFDGTADLNMEAADFTIECRIYPFQANGLILQKDYVDGAQYERYSLFVNSTGRLACRFGGGGDAKIVSTVTIPTAKWTAVALERNGTTFTLYVDGVAAGTATYSGSLGTDASRTLDIGQYSSSSGSVAAGYFYGYIDELRITKGVARYKGNYTVAAAPFTLVGPPAAMDQRSVAFTAAAVPARGSMFVLAKARANAISPNVNFLADISRDGGTTWTTGTLVAAGSYGGFTMYEANGFDISGQPSGTSMRWRLRTVGTALGVAVDAVVAQWG